MKNPSNLIVAVVLVACVSSFGMLAYIGHDLGAGGVERMIFYPAMFWALGFGAYMLAEENEANRMRTEASS